ncbi:MAG: hypothetical protein U1F27_12335 [Turneriella sp.]
MDAVNIAPAFLGYRHNPDRLQITHYRDNSPLSDTNLRGDLAQSKARSASQANKHMAMISEESKIRRYSEFGGGNFLSSWHKLFLR